jgi:hypothetical protein
VIIGYTLSPTKISVNQYNAIQSPVICATLNKMGIDRNVAWKIVFEPNNLGGLEIHHLYTIQGTQRLQYFLGNVMCNDGNVNLVRICMESTQLEVGSYKPFLSLDYKVAGSHLLNKMSMTAIWEHLSLFKGTITTKNPWLPLPQTVNDVALMSIASRGEFTDKQKQHINACIIYLQVISPSDITTFDGLNITQLAYEGKRENVASSLIWPNQQRPPKACWNTWREFLLLQADGNMFLFLPLVHWTLHNQCLRPWKWYNIPNPDILFEWTGTQWFHHNKQGRSLNKYSKDRIRMTETQQSSPVPKSQSTVLRWRKRT